MNLDVFRNARQCVAPFLRKTPLLFSEELNGSAEGTANIYLKCENFQVTRSFKVRGALNAMIEKSAEAKGFICRSSGNFAQGMALGGQKLHVPVTVVMPTYAPKVKVDNAKRLGARVILCGTTHYEGYQKVRELEEQGAGLAISSFDDPAVIAGYGTVALEIFEDLPSLQHFFCPVGGGGLMSGCAAVLKAFRPSIEIVAVEPTGASDFFLSFLEGEIRSIEHPETIADGLRAPSVGQYNWPILKKNVDRVQLVNDDEVIDAMKLLFDRCGLVVEPSGAVALAGLLKRASTLTGDCACVITGGNVDKEQFLRWIEG